MSSFDDEDTMTEDDPIVSLEAIDHTGSDDSIDLEESDLADFDFGSDNDMTFVDEDEPV